MILLLWLVLLVASLRIPVQLYRWWRQSKRVLVTRSMLDSWAKEP